ncbi:hypothetical protein [Treponema porcinum]|uniref:hypothetical protein n=1 Tax=Treponema porcinum TaxID=261392 RepID=UPI002357C07E|nr:hypothetical protein [Treponema porcinum]MCI6322946.1 hypothetical protein [Treponema porcinum]MCI6721215.1 hypothetical protein [Treponema porcinum]
MKKIFLSISIAAAVFGFSGCYDAIFYNIRNEVPLEDGVINGYTNSIVRYQAPDGTEFLYLQNGNVYYKQISEDTDKKILTKNQGHGKWTKDSSAPEGISYSYFDQEFSGTYSCKLASDSKYVYLLGATPEYDESSSRNILKNFKLYCYSKENGWKSVDAVNTILKKYESTLAEDKYMMDSSIQLFCTNTPQNAHRKAYIRIGGGSPYYSWMSDKQTYGNDFTSEVINCGIIELNGTDTDIANVVPLGDGKIGTLEKTGAGKDTTSAVYANGEVYFLDYLASSTNETKDKDADYIYFGNGKTLYWFNTASVSSVKALDADPVGKSAGCADSILSMCVTNDSIILGTYEEGAYRVKTDSGKPETSTSDFTTNADSVMYNPYIVRMLFCTDPSLGETDNGSALYSALQFQYTESSASASYKNVGLWSYYNSEENGHRNNWNKE